MARKRYENVNPDANIPKGFGQVLKWRLTSERAEWPAFVRDNAHPDFNKIVKHGRGAVTYINHATDFLQLPGLSFLTDPVFSERVSPFQTIGPKRHRAPGATLAELPKVDFVLISHNHYDHLDIASIKHIKRRDNPCFIVPVGDRDLLVANGIVHVVELEWWQSHQVGDAKITFVPMQHWSARGLRDRNLSLWGGYVIEGAGLKVLFSGDTGYCAHFKEIHDKFGAMDLSILPIGAYEPRWFMKHHHMNPEDAVQAHLDLRSKFSVATHFGTFQLTDESMEEPVLALDRALRAAKVDSWDFVPRKNGQTLSFGAK